MYYFYRKSNRGHGICLLYRGCPPFGESVIRGFTLYTDSQGYNVTAEVHNLIQMHAPYTYIDQHHKGTTFMYMPSSLSSDLCVVYIAVPTVQIFTHTRWNDGAELLFQHLSTPTLSIQ